MPTPDYVRNVARQLSAPGTTTNTRLKIVTDLRDSVDVVHVALPEVLSGLEHVLETTTPQSTQNDEHKLRKSSIEVLHRVPHTTALKDHVPRLAECLQNVALQDNQENAIVAMKVVLDLMRAFKPELEEAAIPMLKVFVKLYTCWTDTYRHYFSEGFGDMTTDEDPTYLEMQPSIRSFRLVAECPLAVLHLHQLYGERMQPHVPPLVDLMVRALGIGPSEAPPNLRQVYKDLKFAQVKTLAFLSHYIRQAPATMQPYERAICDSLVNLLNTCPDVVLWRKELLISMRTVLATDFKKTLNERLDDFKEEEALVGKSRECYEVLRHYGYAVFAELAHQTRTSLKVPQLSWIVHRSCCIIHDPARPASSHSTAVRLLGNLVEVIHKYRTEVSVAEKCRDLLRKILDCFVVKLNHVRHFPKLNPELWSLLQFIFIGLRTVLYSLSYKRGPPTREPLKEEEVRLAAKIVKGGLDCLKLCSKQAGVQNIMEAFTDVFIVMDAWDFVEIMMAKMDYLFESIKADNELLGLIGLLLDKKQVGLHFIDILGAYLADKKLDVLESPDSEEAQLVLQLFRLIFQVFVRLDICQIFDAPDSKFRFVGTLSRTVEQCLDLIQTKPKPQGYLRLLWFLFKSKIHFQDLDSLMLPALELFLSMLDGPDVGVRRDVIVELCLLLPLELEKKYPILYKLMKPLVMALKGHDEIVAVGIETLEEWVDRLNPEFLEPAMSTVVEELNLALWSHLRPQPYPFGPKVLQLLGKLGGRNRRFLKNPLHLDCKENSEHGLRLILTFHPETKFLVPLDKCIALARKGLDGRAASSAGHNAVYYRRQALKFLHGCLAAMMNLYTPDKKSLDIDTLRSLCEQSPALRVERSSVPKTEEQSTKTKSQLAAEKQVLITLISSVIVACSDSELSESAEPFAKGVCRHFAILFALGHGISTTPKNLFQEVSSSDMQLDPMMKDLDVVLFLDALVEVLSSDKVEQARTGEQALCWFIEMLLELHPNMGPGGHVFIDLLSSSGQPDAKKKDLHLVSAHIFGLPPVLDVLLPKIINCCFKDDWQSRMGGMVAVGVIVDKLPRNYLMHITPRLLHALLNVLRSLPVHSVASRENLRALLKRLLHLAFGLGQTEEAGPVISCVPFDCVPVSLVIEKLSTTVLSPNTPPITRQYSDECLSIIAGAYMKAVAEIVNPYVMAPTSSIRSALEDWKAAVMKLRNVKHVNMEGISCALTYAINLRLPALEDVLKDVLDFVRNIVLVCEYTEDTLRTKYGARVTNQKSFQQLRESGLELLVAVTDWPVFVNIPDIKEKPNNLKNFLKPILKKLIVPNEKLRQIAKRGLANLIRHEVIHQKLSESLKPHFQRIQQYQTLDLQLLKGATAALELVPEWFNQSDGERLLEHLRKWIDPDAHSSVQRPWPQEDDTKIAAAMLELFHLLPSSASTFLETFREHTTSQRIGLVVLTIELEDRLGRASTSGPTPRVLWSPYRTPLTKFLVKYAKESVKYFLSPTRMHNSYFMRFTDIIKSEMGKPLLQELLNSPNQILVVLTGDAMIPDTRGAARVPVMASIHALHLVRILVKLAPRWLSAQRPIVDQLIEMWRSPKRLERLKREQELSQIEVLESKVIAKCLLNYISARHDEVSPLLDIVSIFVHKTKVDFSFIRKFCKEIVAKEYAYKERSQVLHHVFDALMKGQLLEDHAVFALRVIVNPVLSHLAKQKDMENVVMTDLVLIFIRIVKAKETQGRLLERDVCLEVELLEVGKLLVIGVPKLIEDHSCKDLLKYAWNFLKCENLECKSHAFLLVAHILSTYALTDMIMLQVFVNLLKSDFADTKKHLIREALDVLVPALVARFQAEEEQDFPIWIRYAHKHMLAEGHKLNLLVNLWQMVVRHPDLFYKFRIQFLAQMVNTLSRLRLPANASMENRRMAVDMARVIVEWEVRRVRSSGAGQLSGDVTNRSSDQGGRLVTVKKEEDDVPGGPSDCQAQSMGSQPLIEEPYVNMTRMVVTFLAKMAFTLATDSRDEDCRALYEETMHVLHCALDIWPNVDFRLDFVEKLLESNRPQNHDLTPVLVTGLDLVNAALEKQPAVFVENGWRQIYFLAGRVMVMQKEELVTKLCSALHKVYIAAKDSLQVKMVQEAIERQVLSKYLDPTSLEQQTPGEFEVAACLKILGTIAEVSPQTVVRFMHPMIKLLEQYSKECGMTPQINPNQINSERRNLSVPAFGTVHYSVCCILRLTGPRIHCCNGPVREYLLKAMLEFVYRRSSKPPDRAIFLEILRVVEGWLKNPESLTGDGLGSKEIIWALQQIARLDAQGLVDVSTKKEFEDCFLEMLYKLCTTPELPQDFRQEVFVHVEQSFLAGFRSTDPGIRSRFFQLYKPRVGTSLFDRLKYILQNQEWDQMASRFWLKQALDFLLAVLCEEEPITLSPNSAHVVALPDHVWRHNHDGDKMEIEEGGVGVSLQVKSEGGVKLELRQEVTEVSKLQQILNEHAMFLRMTGDFTVRDLIHPLREYAHVDAQLAYHLWVLVFPIVWATLDKSNQVSLAKPVITLLSKEYHRHQASSRPNVVQALLEGISLSQPQPKIPPELIKYLGKTYNAWHIAIPLLESHVVIFPDELRCFDALAELYQLVSETDVMYGLLKKWCSSDYTHAGLSLIQYGYWDKAAEVFGEACKQEDPKAPPREEWVWTEEWVKCNRELNRWEELHHFGLENSLALAADCAWHLPQPDWQNLRKLVHTRKDQFPDSSRCLMLSIYSALHDGDISTANTNIKRAMQQCLARWWQLPEVGVAPQGQLLQTFQSLVELCESTRALNELNPTQGGGIRPEHSYARLKDILETWRLRTPNEWEPLSHWCDVLMWRHQIYSSIANTFSNLDPAVPHLHHLGVKDKAWSINRLAFVARRHGSCDVCIEIVNNMYNYNFMDVQEAFIKIVEQAKAYLAMPEEQKTGLNMLYTTNLEYFPHQGLQSEIFRLKGMFHQALNETELANQCFSTSVALNHQLPEAWLCWGAFCDEIYQQTKGTPGSSAQLEYAVGSYLQAIQLQSPAAKNLLPRCLQLLSFDETGTVVKAFQGFEPPSWVWLFYIPQLLVGLHRQEGKVFRPVLIKMVTDHPQSLYYYLRVYLLSSREALNKLSKLARQEHQAAQQRVEAYQHQHGHQGGGQGGATEGMHGEDTHGTPHMLPEHQTEYGKFEAAKELMERLKQQLGPMAATLDLILREIASKFIAKPEERLMAVVHALLTRCYKVSASQNSDVPKNLVDELDGVCRACFPEARGGNNVHRDLRESFVQHLNPSAEGFPRTLGALTNLLKCWRNRLSAYLDDEIAGALQLHLESPTLQEIDLTGVEMPCQHSTCLDYVGDGVVFLEKIGSQVAIVRRQGSALRRLMFYGSNGHVTHYILQTGQVFSQPASSDEHMVQLLRLMNRLLDKHPPCRSRSLNWFAPVIIPVWTQVRLVEEDPSYTTYFEAYEMNCTRYGREPDHPVLHFKKIIHGQSQGLGHGQSQSSDSNIRYNAFTEILKFHDTNVFSQFMYKILPSCNHLWVFKRQFCAQMALSSLISLMLRIGGRVPGKILFTKSSGRVYQMEFAPQFDNNGLLQKNHETVPFRLTRNLATFFTPFGVEGIFITAMVVAVEAIFRTHTNIESCLAMLFRDELLARSSKYKSRNLPPMTNEALRGNVEKNVQMAVKQLQKLLPTIPSGQYPPEPVNKGARELVEREAQNPCRLCWMEPTWHPWY